MKPSVVDRLGWGAKLFQVGVYLQARIFRQHLADATAGVVIVSVGLNVILVERAVSNRGGEIAGDAGAAFILVGVVRIGWGLVEAVTENLWSVAGYPRSGQLTIYLLRPTPVLVQLMIERLYFERLVEVPFGFVLVYVGLGMTGLELDPFVASVMLLIVILAAFVYLGTIVYGAAFSVVAWNSEGLVMTTLGNIATLSHYPASIFFANNECYDTRSLSVFCFNCYS